MGEKRNAMIIALAGNAKSKFLESIKYARMKKAKLSVKSYKEGERELFEAISINSNNTDEDISLLLIHAQNHLMNAILLKDITGEIIKIFESNDTL